MVPAIAWFAVTVAVLFTALHLGVRLYCRGFLAGMRREADCWCDAMSKLKPPNWQSMPLTVDGDREKSEHVNKVYAAAYRAVLDVIREEIVTNRTAAFLADVEGGSLLGSPRQ